MALDCPGLDQNTLELEMCFAEVEKKKLGMATENKTATVYGATTHVLQTASTVCETESSM